MIWREYMLLNKTLYKRVVERLIEIREKEGRMVSLQIAGFSMEPLLYSGDIVKIQKQTSYEVGDVVAYFYNQELIIHRIIERKKNGEFVCRGDNAVASEIIFEDQILGKIVNIKKRLRRPCKCFNQNEIKMIRQMGTLQINEKWFEQVTRIVDVQSIDWNILRRLCLEQRMYAQFLQVMVKTRAKDYISAEDLNRYRVEYAFQCIQYERYRRELIRIQKYLRDNGVERCVTFKGISYYNHYYLTEKNRQLGDIDLIVDKKDIVKAVRLIEKLGYHSMDKNKGWTDQMYAEDSLGNIHVAQLSTKQYEVELHVDGYYYSGLDLKKVRKNAVYSMDGVLIPNSDDVFIIACVHAWHHFPMRNNPLRTDYSKLGQLMDVLITYEAMRQKYSHEQIMEICRRSNIEEIARIMICTAYMMFKQKSNPLIITKDENKFWRWIYNDEVIELEDRYFNGTVVADTIDQWYHKVNRDMEIHYRKEVFSLEYRLEPSFEDKKNRWVNNILETSQIHFPEAGMDFGFDWDEQSIGFGFYVEHTLFPCNKLDRFSIYNTHIILRIAFSEEEEPRYILFQNNHQGVSAYYWPEGRAWKTYARIDEEIRCERLDNGWICRVPTERLGIQKLHTEDRFLVDVNIHIAYKDEQEYCDLSWSAGNGGNWWDETKECKFMTRVTLME